MGRYRCFLPDLAGFAVFPCAGPGYQGGAFHRGIVAAPLSPLTSCLIRTSRASVSPLAPCLIGALRALSSLITPCLISTSRAPLSPHKSCLISTSWLLWSQH